MARTFTIGLSPQSFITDAGAEVVAGDLGAVPELRATTQRPCVAFADGAAESVAFSQFVLPQEYAGTGTLKARLLWCCPIGDNTKKVNWEAYIEALTPGDAVDLSTTSSFDAANDDGGSACNATAYYLIATVISLANKDSVAAGDAVRLAIRRDSDDAENDTAEGTAYLIDCEVYEE